jgi:hypothetical protein
MAVSPPDFSHLFSGPEVKLVNISKAGAKLECDWRLSTAANVCLRLVTADTVFLLKGRVLRSKPATEGASAGPFESVLAFDEDFLLLAGGDSNVSLNSSGPSDFAFGSDSYEAGTLSNPPILTVTASSACSGSEMREILDVKP